MTKINSCYGFLYHPQSQQILLQKDSSDPSAPWTLLSCQNGKILGLKVLPIYDYVAKGKKQYISYALTKKLLTFPPQKKFLMQWFSFKEIAKLPVSGQVKQDIIVGRRVIDSQTRKDAGERTIG